MLIKGFLLILLLIVGGQNISPKILQIGGNIIRGMVANHWSRKKNRQRFFPLRTPEHMGSISTYCLNITTLGKISSTGQLDKSTFSDRKKGGGIKRTLPGTGQGAAAAVSKGNKSSLRQSAQCSVPSAQCSVLSSQFPVPSTQCPVLSAQCAPI